MNVSNAKVSIIGAGPAGLMAAEVLALQGIEVDLFDAMPSVGRKFLLAGVGGMNITHSEPHDSLLKRYQHGEAQAKLTPMLNDFDSTKLRQWIHDLGIETFVGTSGRVFPTDMKAAPLLRAWLQRLKKLGVRVHVRHRWLGWTDSSDQLNQLPNTQQQLRFATVEGDYVHTCDATLLALGGASWAKLGSDGKWLPLLQNKHVHTVDFQAANCGFDGQWSDFLRTKFAGSPLKNVAASAKVNDEKTVGEFIITATGIEGSLVYALSSQLREQINAEGFATLFVDLLPQFSVQQVIDKLSQPRGSDSLAKHLKRKLKLDGLKAALLHEVLDKAVINDAAQLGFAIKSLPLTVNRPRPIDEAISTSGGIAWASLNDDLMLTPMSGVFCAGEMIDWEAPTGGYLLTACFATGRHAANGIVRWLAAK